MVREKINELTQTETDSDIFNSRGITMYNYGYPIVVWFPKGTKNEYLINHELLHVVVSILQWANVPLSDDTEEVYAFELQYITKQFYNNVR